jgi:sterol 3beta-glucosyltransferase
VEISIIAPGSRGDVQPYLALAKGLRAAGHGARLVTTRDHAGLVREHGLDPWVADIDVQAELGRPEARAAVEGGGLLRSFRRFSEIAARGAGLVAEQALAASSGADAVLSGFGGLFIAASVAEKLGLPLVQAYNVPITPTAAFPGVLTPWLSLPPRSVTHRLGHRISRQALWLTARASSNGARRRVLGLPSAPRIGPFESGILRAAPVVYGLSPAVFRRPADWDARVHMRGFWFLDEEAAWTPPAELEAFLRAGPAPVYIGFGSMSSRDPGATARLVLEAVDRSGCRAVIHTGWDGLAPAGLPDTVIAVGSVPHAWLFPRVAAVVHHGGAGTTAAGIRAGVPTITVPFHGDQPFWGRLVRDLGVGPDPIPRKRLNAAGLADAIRTALTDASMADRASVLGAAVRAEDGVGDTVAELERLMA